MRFFKSLLKTTPIRFARCERGTQLVELAIVLPVLLTLLATTAEFARFFHTYSTLSKATRSAARYLTTAPVDGSDDEKARNLVVYGSTVAEGDPLVHGMTTLQVNISREGGVASAGMYERVTVEIDGYNYQPIFDPGAFIGNDNASLNVEVSPKTTMRFMTTTAGS
ncbi:MAG TPA: TadE family protein [Pyrinomonadaceae bacterium]